MNSPVALAKEVLPGQQLLHRRWEGRLARFVRNEFEPGLGETPARGLEASHFPPPGFRLLKRPADIGEDNPDVAALNKVHFGAIGVIEEIAPLGALLQKH